MNQKDVWKKYITAHSKILKFKSKPIGIDTSKSVQLDGLKLQLSIDQEIFKQVFKKEVEQVFNVKDFDFESGYVLASLENTAHITTDRLSELKELAEKCYIEFNENPVIEGSIIENSNTIKDELKNVLGELPTSDYFIKLGQIHLTIEQWKIASAINWIKFDKKASARFNVKPSAKFITQLVFQNQYFLDDNVNLITKGALPEDVIKYLSDNLNLKLKHLRVLIAGSFLRDSILANSIKTALQENFGFYPFVFDNVISIKVGQKEIRINEFDTFSAAIDTIKLFVTKHFGDSDFEISNEFFYSYDKAMNNSFMDNFIEKHRIEFENALKSSINDYFFRIDQNLDAIYFDFEEEEELKEKISLIKSNPVFDIYDRGEKHKYKFNIKFETGLHELQGNLKKVLPNINTKLIANGEKLIFRKFYKSGNKGFERDRLNDQLSDFLGDTEFTFSINDTFQEKYLCEENFELKIEQEEEKLSKLLREEFYFGNPTEKFYLGKLQKANYPDLYFVVDEDRIEEVKESISEKEVKAIFPDLKGEKDKIKRLEDTVFKLDDENTKLPNDNAKVFLYDSSKAKSIKNIEYLLNKTSAEWQDFENNLFSKSLNESQKQAIYKSLFAEELALIQGPPGTGKSTAIAEIIWQHIRKEQKQRILLTSETNLAVDNAIDRLKNKQNNIVKPIRFGNTENLESEGYFYSLEAIENWEKGNTVQSNTVSHWMNNISNRITKQDDEQINSELDKWKKHLQNPKIETRTLFTDKYLEFVNLIGATGSSIGKLNSENKWTSFFRSYLNVYNRDSYENNEYRDCDRIDINFDTVIMDEASKATPPELALPVLYGKKSVIVGDHRQLPPMIDGEEIKELLISIGEKGLAKTLSQKEFETSQFERLFENIDESIRGTFDTQYRMHPAINDAIAQFYKDDGGLNCGLPLQETYHISFDKWDSRYHGLRFENILTPETHTILYSPFFRPKKCIFKV